MKNIKIEPIISEKTTGLASLGFYSFKVPLHLGKKEAAAVVEDIFKVKIIKINSLSRPAKTRRSGKRISHTKPYKKILVKLKKGQKIDIFENEK